MSSVASVDPEFLRSNAILFRDVLSTQLIKGTSEVIRARQEAGVLTETVAERMIGALGSDAEYSPEEPFDAKGSEEAPPSLDAKRLSAAGNYSACALTLEEGDSKPTIAQQELLASCAFFSGEFRKASLAAESLMRNPSTSIQGLYWASKAAEKLAVAAITRAGELEPNSPQMWVLIGDVYRQKRHWSEAESAYRRATDLDSKNRNARLNLAIVLFTQLKNDEAFALDKLLLAEAPGDSEANLLAGEILVQQHEYEKAEPYLLNCRRLDADLQPRLHVLLGQVYSETNRIPDAIAEYKLGLSTDHDGSIHYQLARLYQKAGNSALAAEQFRVSKQLREHWDNQAHVAMEQRSTDISRQ